MTELVAPFVPVHGSWTFLPDTTFNRMKLFSVVILCFYAYACLIGGSEALYIRIVCPSVCA